MTQSVLVHGPQGCGKTCNAPAIAKALGLLLVFEWENIWRDKKALNEVKKGGCLILHSDIPCQLQGSRHIKVMAFKEAMGKVSP